MTVSFDLDGEVVLFDPDKANLFLLNPAASLVWLCLEDGLTREEAAQCLASAADIPLAQAQTGCDAIVAQWEEQQLTQDSHASAGEPDRWRPAAWPEPTPPPPPSTDDSTIQRTYQIADFRFLLRSGRTPADEGVHEFLRYLEVAPGPEPVHVMDLDSGDTEWQLALAGKVIDKTRDATGLLPMMHRCLLVAAMRGSDAASALHAAVLLYRGSTILLAGTSGSGKSTLTAALFANGFAYCGDDMALLSSPPIRVRGVPSRLRLLEESWPVIQPLWPELAEVPPHRRHDGRLVRYFVPGDFDAQQQPATGLPADLLIFPRYREKAQLSVERLSRGRALVLLTDAGYNFSEILTEQLVRDFIDWMTELRCYSIDYGDLNDAARAIQSLAETEDD